MSGAKTTLTKAEIATLKARDREAFGRFDNSGNRIAGKVTYVKRAGQIRNHECHWPGCGRQVPPAMWGCTRHWYMLPAALRAKVWASFRPGQEVNGTPSASYIAVAREVQDWIKTNHPQGA